MKKREKNYKINVLYNTEPNAKDLDEVLERLFKKYLIEYEK